MIVIGVDTALRCTGYGVIDVQGKRMRAVDCGVIRNTAKLSLSECIRRLAGGIEELVKRYQPAEASIEGGFYFRNVRTAMVLGMARGAAVSVLATSQIPVYEYAPRRAKQVVVGYGNASKEQVATCMAQLLGLNVDHIPNDSTDAISLAVCHVLTRQAVNGIYLPKPL